MASDVLTRALSQIPDLAAAQRVLATSPDSALRAARGTRPDTDLQLESAHTDDAVDLLAFGAATLEKVRRDGAEAKLTHREELALEAVILTVGRPALLIQYASFPPAPVGWESLEQNRDAIEKTIPSVGRIDLIADRRYHAGTGFVVAPNLVMTNAHVIEKFGSLGDGGVWTMYAGRQGAIEMRGEKAVMESSEFRVSKVVDVHTTLDIALLEIEPASVNDSAPSPQPLSIAGRRDAALDVEVYLVGYPVTDHTGQTPDTVIEEIFGTASGVKRLQPGLYVRDIDDAIFAHDCSTLGGNSGSCIVEIATNQVIGLHFQGHYGVRNDAVSLWRLRDDPLFRGRIEFVS